MIQSSPADLADAAAGRLSSPGTRSWLFRSSVARMLAIMESICGTLFVGVLIARLVSLYTKPAGEIPENQPESTNALPLS